MVAIATISLLTCSLLTHQGLRESTRSLQWRKKESHCLRRVGNGVVSAKFELKPPPYSLNALEPHMSRETLEYHWGKHHRTYVENLNKQIVGTELDGRTLEDIVIISYNKGDFLPVFNNAAQPLLTIDVWEHAYYLDFQNCRTDYISIFMEKLVSWEAVSARLEEGKARADEREEERRKKEEEEEKSADGDAVEMYLDTDTDESEAE